MSDTNQSIPCTCTNCPGASCTCGCQQGTTPAAIEAACACGPQCQCGEGCSCAQS